MDSAEAMAQISAVMSAPSEPVAVVVLYADGKTSEATIDHRKVTELLGATPTVVGAIRALGAQAVARRDGKGKVNAHALPDTFEPKVKGDIVLLRTAADAAGSPLALTLREYDEWVAAGMPEGEEDEEDEEGEEFGDESEGEESEGEEDEDVGESEGEEDEGEEEEGLFENVAIPELKKACELVGIGGEGTREELLARLVAHAKERTAEEEEEEEEEDEKEAPPKKGHDKKANGPSPSKEIAKKDATKRARK